MNTTRQPRAAAPQSAISDMQSGINPLRRGLGVAGVLAALIAMLLIAAGWHVTQGTSGIGIGHLLGWVTGDEMTVSARDVFFGSRLPRVAAGVLVGIALGVAGALFQSLARNALASPDTLAVTAGSYLAVTIVAALGITVPLWASSGVAFVGGLAAAALVLSLAGGAGASTTRLILAGTATALALQSGTSAFLILFDQETTSLFAWGSGSLSQLGLEAAQQAAPVILLMTGGAMLMSRRFDLLGLGDDSASVLGVPVRSTRAIGILMAVVLTATSVTLAGPIGFVGLCAPVVTRLLARLVPVLHRHVVLIPASGLVGGIIVIVSDAVLRAVIGADAAIAVPTGVTTTLLGAVILIALARRARDSGPTRQPRAARTTAHSTRRTALIVACGVVLLVATAIVALLAGERWLLTGDVALWLQGNAPPVVSYALDGRAPRIAAALLAGAALALAGTFVQASARNPLAEPGILGITGGAGLGAVIIVTLVSGGGTLAITAAAVGGALLGFALVYGLSWRRGMNSDRLVLIGIGLWYGFSALTTFLLVRANPWDTPKIYTWLSGSTYGKGWIDVLPVAVALAVALPLAVVWRRELDLLSLDDDTPRLVGVARERVRFLVLLTAAVLAALSVAAVGVVGFVGLVAPHAARALVGGRHARVIPVALLLGALLLVVSDAVGRTLIAPAQLPAGLIVALIGAPYFIYLLARSRA